MLSLVCGLVVGCWQSGFLGLLCLLVFGFPARFGSLWGWYNIVWVAWLGSFSGLWGGCLM